MKIISFRNVLRILEGKIIGMPTKQFFGEFLVKIALRIPINMLRMFFYRMSGIKIGKNSHIWAGTFFNDPLKVTIGDNTLIGPDVTFLSWGGITIGNNVNISGYSFIISQSHDIDDPMFCMISSPVIIEDYVWIGTGAMILPGIHIGKGAVVGVGSIITKDVPAYTLVAGNPAREVKKRNINLNYTLRERRALRFR